MSSSPGPVLRIWALRRGATRCTRIWPTPQSSPIRCECSGSAIEGGKPKKGETGAQPEWFYKGDGSILAPPEGDLASPAFALDAGEEPEIVGIYVIDGAGATRCGSVSRSATNSPITSPKGRTICGSLIRSCGPQASALSCWSASFPWTFKASLASGGVREVIWERAFLSGEQNMAHSVANLEAHHFKYPLFRRPGDVHVHFFGTATLSFSEGVRRRKATCSKFNRRRSGCRLRNRLTAEKAAKTKVRSL